jgi:hypothetical protein
VIALLLPTLFNLIFGLAVGAVVLVGVNLVSRLRSAE